MRDGVASNTPIKCRKYVIIDTTAIPIDINTWRKRFDIGKGKNILGLIHNQTAIMWDTSLSWRLMP
ncbi:MAG: hypothetical protein FIB08_16000 [Candidatus Methanoperedens sp.]|nr:hypothetical protein [Candidatus Methanoperedens sp.]